MEVRKISGLNVIALAFILFLLITSNSGLENEWHYIRSGRDVGAIMESNPITPSKAVKSYIGEEKKREKRFVFLLPAAPLFAGMSATTGMGLAAAGIGATAAIVASRQGPFQSPGFTSPVGLPQFTSPYPANPSSGIYMQASKPKSPTENKPSQGQSTPSHTGPKPAPKADEITAFPGLDRAKPKTTVQNGGGKRNRWKDEKGKIYEWDSKKGEVEVYDKTGKKHEGGYDPYDHPPRRVSDPVPGRKVEP